MEPALPAGINGNVQHRDHLAHTGFDLVEETSVQSFPASDGPGWAIGRGFGTARRSGDVNQCIDIVRKEETSRVSNSQQEDRTTLFR